VDGGQRALIGLSEGSGPWAMTAAGPVRSEPSINLDDAGGQQTSGWSREAKRTQAAPFGRADKM
jgi:hypothetical protein